jgi:diguanylate cyclase (GGDEF)-like protein
MRLLMSRKSPPFDGPPRRSRRVTLFLYTLLGVVLGIGAPAGALLLRILMGARDPWLEIRSNAFFYLYEHIGTSVVFGLAGLLAGLRAERLRRGRDRYHALAEHDPLTQLANAQAFQSHFRRSVEHAARFQEPLSLLLIDVDKLKNLNDRFGHSCGSAALVHVAGALTACKRADDVAARWGGDEFALLMPGADGAAARRQAQAILGRLQDSHILHEGLTHAVSVTIGAATSGPDGAGDDLFDRADAALYAGKRAGGGRLTEAAI